LKNARLLQIKNTSHYFIKNQPELQPNRPEKCTDFAPFSGPFKKKVDRLFFLDSPEPGAAQIVPDKICCTLRADMESAPTI